MRDAEQTIERLLAGLRDAEPPAGIERRILQALDGMEARQISGAAWPWRRPILPLWSRPAMAISLACAAMLIVAITNYQSRHAAPVVRSPSPGSDVRQAEVAQKATVVPRRLDVRVAVRRPRTQDVTVAGETQEASFPAPPLPLSEQERLLLRLAHRGDAEKMDLLNPDVQAAQIAKATEQFQHFFDIDPKDMRSQSE
jgi:hypothetical protein